MMMGERRRGAQTSCRASKYGRMTSPARAGSTAPAGKPDRCRTKRRNEVCPADWCEQVLPPQRSAIVSTVTPEDSATSQESAFQHSPHRRSGLAPREENGEQRNRERENDHSIEPTSQRVYYKGAGGMPRTH
jgi:hypothetical protein